MSKIMEKILSFKNSQDKTHKIFSILGIKIKFKKNTKKAMLLIPEKGRREKQLKR